MRQRTTSEQPGHLVRSPRWNGLVEGDAVIVDGVKERRQHWNFVAHVRNEESGEEWINVRGGRSGEAKNRSFRVEQIFPTTAKRGAKLIGPSLAQAPQLQLR